MQNLACSQNLEFPFRDGRAGASKKTVKKVAVFDIVPSQACSAGCDWADWRNQMETEPDTNGF